MVRTGLIACEQGKQYPIHLRCEDVTPIENVQEQYPFLAEVVERLARLPGVRTVALGGSRATEDHGPDSDWDLAIYYRGDFSPEYLRRLVQQAQGWEGDVAEIGGWGGGIFNGGAWLTVEGRRVDVHYRNLAEYDLVLAAAQRGDFEVERLSFYLVGIPSYSLLAEAAINRVLVGDLPAPDYPAPLRRSAYQRWRWEAEATLDYADAAYVSKGHLTEALGCLAVASMCAGHAVLAAQGRWVPNDKRLLDAAGLRSVDSFFAHGPRGDLAELFTDVAANLHEALDVSAGASSAV